MLHAHLEQQAGISKLYTRFLTEPASWPGGVHHMQLLLSVAYLM
jgi:hypothetical protein